MITEYVLAFQRRDSAGIVTLVSVGHFFSHLYLIAYPPLFPMFMTEFSLSNTQLGFIMGLMYLGPFLFQIPVGWLVDRAGAKWVLVGGITLTAIGTMLVSTAPTYRVLLAFVFLASVGQASFHPADYALLDAVIDRGRIGKNFSVHTFAGFAGSGLAPVLIGGVALAYGWRTALLAIGVVGIVYAMLMTVFLGPVYRDQLNQRSGVDGVLGGMGSGDGVREALLSVQEILHPSILALFGFFVLMVIGEVGIQTFTVVFLLNTFSFEPSIGNTALSAFFALSAIGILSGGVLADRYRSSSIIIVSLSILCVTIWFITSGSPPTVPLVAIGLFGASGFIYGTIQPSRDQLISTVSTEDAVGKSFGLVFTGASLGGFISPAILGTIIDITSSTVAFVVIGATFAAAAGVVTLVRLIPNGSP
jgi:MFS family permease